MEKKHFAEENFNKNKNYGDILKEKFNTLMSKEIIRDQQLALINEQAQLVNVAMPMRTQKLTRMTDSIEKSVSQKRG